MEDEVLVDEEGHEYTSIQSNNLFQENIASYESAYRSLMSVSIISGCVVLLLLVNQLSHSQYEQSICLLMFILSVLSIYSGLTALTNKTLIRIDSIAAHGDYKEALRLYRQRLGYTNDNEKVKQLMEYINIQKALEREKALDYKTAIKMWDDLQMPNRAKQLRQLLIERERVSVAQKVVHGDEVTSTTIQDSVVSKSNISTAKDESDIISKIRELSQMRDEGILTDEQFEAAKEKLLS